MTILRALTSSREDRAIQATAWGDWGDSTATYAGVNVTNETALQLLTVYGCNRFICDGISTLPVDVLRRLGDGSPQHIRTPDLITHPTDALDFTAWATQVLTSLLMAGNAYLYLLRQDGQVRQMLPLDPGKVTVRREQGRKSFYVEGQRFSPFDIGHIPGVMWPGSDVGLSPLEAARQTIGSGLATKEFGGRFFGQGASLSGVIEVPGEMTPDKAREMARAWGKKHSGVSKANLPGVLQGGAQWKPTGVTNEQSQFLETQGYTASEIAAQMFLIDPAEMGLPVNGTSLTYANLEQRNARKVQVTFLPWITRLESFLTNLLPRPQYLKLNVSGLLRGDTKTRYESYAVGIASEFMVPNQARELEDWAPLDGGDEVVKKAEPAPAPAQRDEVHVHPQVNVQVDPPSVFIDPPDVRVEPSNVVVSMAQGSAGGSVTRKRVERNDRGQVLRVVEEFEDRVREVERDEHGRVVRTVEARPGGVVREVERDEHGRVACVEVV